ncbi:45040_t:CDS:1, partial [Gigaspora margarita]
MKLIKRLLTNNLLKKCKLKVLQVAIDELPGGWEEVLEVTSLNNLDLSKYDIGPNGLIKITKTLKNLKILSLEENNIEVEG